MYHRLAERVKPPGIFKFTFLLILLQNILCVFPVGAFEIGVNDDTGARIHLPKPAQRIVSLAPHTTELLFAAGAGDAVVGVTEFSDYPPEARALPLIGNSSNLNLEAIVSLQPDLIVAWKSGNTSGQIDQLLELGLPVFFSEPRKLLDIPSNLERLGRLAGTESTANKSAEIFRHDLRELIKTYEHKTPVKVFYEIWSRPLMTINGEHLISQIITLCGGINIFNTLPTLAPSIDFESVLKDNPDVIISASSAQLQADWYKKWLQWPQLNAVKYQRFYYIEPDIIQRQTPRILEGARLICTNLEDSRQSLSTITPP